MTWHFENASLTFCPHTWQLFSAEGNNASEGRWRLTHVGPFIYFTHMKDDG